MVASIGRFDLRLTKAQLKKEDKMFGKCKYIMLRDTEPVLFPNTIEHDSVANALGRSRVTSAGFVLVFVRDCSAPSLGRTDPLIVEVYGESESLKLSSREFEDAYWIKKMLTSD